MNIFEVKNLSFTYPKGKEKVLNDISFNIEQGTIFGLLGRSGAGKSTTQKILIKLLENYSGEILYMGKDLKTYNSSFYEEIGVGFEMPVHFNKLTGLENMSYFASMYKTKTDINKLFEYVGLEADKNTPVEQYSKGMKVRLNFIRALLNQPKMLFLDEVTNGLDPANAQIIKSLILDFKNNGGTVLLTTHLMNDVEELCDKVAFIHEGKIVESSTPRDLKLKYGKRILNVEYTKNNKTEKKSFNLDNIGNDKEFLKILQDGNIETLHSGETNLNDIFIKLVK